MKRWLPIALGLGAILIVLLRTAWLCDDAYFTFRTVDNWLNGYGPRWNVGERAQGYTHPLWMLLLAALSAATGAIEGSAMALGIVCALATFVVLAWGRRPEIVALIALALAGSKAWTDFATSGLENSLSGLLIAGLARLWLSSQRRMATVGMVLGGLLVVNRLDLTLIALPPLLLWARQNRRWRPLALAALPIAAWLSFALVYYGTLLPTPALAKLALGVPRSTLLQHGLWYLVQPLQLDWVTLPLLLLGLGVGLRGGTRALAVAGVLYLLYVVWIGGDFMSARFHVAPYVLAVALLADRLGSWRPRRLLAVGLAVGIVSLVSPRSPLLAGPHYGGDADPWSRAYTVRNAVIDERAYYYPHSGLLSAGQQEDLGGSIQARAVEYGVYGRLPFVKGPLLHRIDPQALADPFLARLPVPRDDLVVFRPGHAGRIVPVEYIRSWEMNANMFADPVLRPLYADVRLATQASLGAPGRAGAIGRLLWHDLRRLLRGEPLVPRSAITRPVGRDAPAE